MSFSKYSGIGGGGSGGPAITDLTGDVTAVGPGSVPATVAFVGGETAADVATSVTDTQAATDLSTASTLVKRDASGETSLDGLNIDGLTSGTINIKAADTTTNYTVKMPAVQGAASTYLENDGSGNLSWSIITAGVSSVTATAPIASSGGATPDISISQSGAASDGYLSSTDWNTFNNKQPAGTYVTSVGATSPVASSGGTTPTISMPVATALADGYLSSANFTTFNNAATEVSNATALSTINTLMERDGSGETALDGLSLDGSTSGAIKLQAAATTASYTVKMPGAQGAASTFLQNDGSGNLSWTTAATFPTQTGNQYKVLATSGAAVSWQFAGLGDGTLPSNTVILGRDLPSGMTATSGILIGTGSNLGTGASQVIIGASSGRSTTGATGANNTVVGAGSLNNASLTSGANNTIIGQGSGTGCTSSDNVIIGQNAGNNITSFSGNVVIGRSANTSSGGATSVVIGNLATTSTATNESAIAIGASASAVNNRCISIGGSRHATNSIAIGYTAGPSSRTLTNSVGLGIDAGAYVSTSNSVVLGQRAGGSEFALFSYTVTSTNNIFIGSDCTLIGFVPNANTTVQNNMFVGSRQSPISDIYLGQGGSRVASATLQAVRIQPVTVYGSDSDLNTQNPVADSSAANGIFRIAGARGRGTGTGGDVVIETAPPGAAGTTINTLVERLWTKMIAIYPFVGGSASSHSYNLKNTSTFQINVDASTDRVGVGLNNPSVKFEVSGDSQLNGALVVNEAGADKDTRIEGDTDANLVFVDASTDKVGIGTATPAEKLEVNGNLKVTTGDVLIATAGKGLSVKSGTNSANKIFYRNGSPVLNTSSASNTIANTKLLICCRADNTLPNNFSSRNYAFFTAGTGLSGTDAANLYTAVQAYQTTLGRQV